MRRENTFSLQIALMFILNGLPVGPHICHQNVGGEGGGEAVCTFENVCYYDQKNVLHLFLTFCDVFRTAVF